MYQPTQEDYELLLQNSIQTKIKIELLNDKFETIDTLQDALISDNYSVDADSDIRRTYEGVFYVKDPSFFIGENRKIWTDKYIRVWKGRINAKNNQTVWHSIGIYLFNDTSYTYNSNTNQLTINCVDMTSKLNDTFSGQITGALTFEIPCEQQYSEVINKYGDARIISTDGITAAGIKISPGTIFDFSLISPPPKYPNNGVNSIDIGFNDVTFLDKNGQLDENQNKQLRLSVDDTVFLLDFENNSRYTKLSLDKSKINKTVSIGFLQNISLKVISVRFNYQRAPSPNAIIVNILDPFCAICTWQFYDSKFVKSVLPVGTTINNGNITVLSRKATDTENNTLKINTSARAVTDTFTKPVSWYSSVIDTIENLAHITDYIVEYSDFTIPYDLEFSAGSTVYDILKELVDLKINYEMFFDIDGILHIQPIPTLYEDDVLITADYMAPLVISETNTDSFSKIRNITEIWGMSIDVSYYTENCRKTSYGYEAVFSDLVFTDEKYISNNTIIGIKIADTNIENPKISVTANYIDPDSQDRRSETMEAIPVYTSSGDALEENTLCAGIAYCFKYYKQKFYYLGQFQIHGMCIETEKEPSEERRKKDKEKYNCENIYYSVQPNSPFCVEKIGERIQVLSGEDFDSIYSDELAVERAKWENWKKTRRQETINLELIDIPWLDVNCKIEYKSYIDGETHQYIVKSINSSTSNGTMTVELMRFYPLYILDAKQYEAVLELKEYMTNLIKLYKYSSENMELLENLLEEGTSEIYLTENTDDVKTVLESYKNRINNVSKIN